MEIKEGTAVFRQILQSIFVSKISFDLYLGPFGRKPGQEGDVGQRRQHQDPRGCTPDSATDTH